MQIFRTEGIILQTLNFQDYDQILSVFSYDEGLIKLIVKGANRSKQRSGINTTPLSCAEFVYTKGRSEIFKCSEISTINQHLKLRESLPSLDAACDIVQAILLSQFPQTESPDLYRLLRWCLEKIPSMRDPYVMASSFRLKLLLHDGLFNLNDTCTTCSETVQSIYIATGETFCKAHAPSYSLQFQADEVAFIDRLLHFAVLSDISNCTISDELREKVMNLFRELVM